MRKRRVAIPYRPDTNGNLWSVIKTSVGKDLSKIPMPVTFNEPISMLQRLAENFEYSKLLDNAFKAKEPGERLVCVAAFTVSAYSTTGLRIAKPFNPLLGETFEFDRSEDLGWKLFSEQVSHHPPIAAQHCRGAGWTLLQDCCIQSRFRGQYMRINSVGSTRLNLDDGTMYTWNRISTTVNNIIMGKLWIDNDGECLITDHKSGFKCILIFFPYCYHNKDKQRRVTGTVYDKLNNAVWSLDGTWDSYIDAKKHPNEPSYRVWKCNEPLANSQQFYNFTLFACQLNEPEIGVAPTDSRHRPDQRLMEEGNFAEADEIKTKLEEKQRKKRKEKEANDIPYKPVWFTEDKDPLTGEHIYNFNGKYWKCKTNSDWSACDDIYSI